MYIGLSSFVSLFGILFPCTPHVVIGLLPGDNTFSYVGGRALIEALAENTTLNTMEFAVSFVVSFARAHFLC